MIEIDHRRLGEKPHAGLQQCGQDALDAVGASFGGEGEAYLGNGAIEPTWGRLVIALADYLESKGHLTAAELAEVRRYYRIKADQAADRNSREQGEPE